MLYYLSEGSAYDDSAEKVKRKEVDRGPAIKKSGRSSVAVLLWWYLFFGAVHELSHLVSYSFFTRMLDGNSTSTFLDYSSLFRFLVRAVLGRYCSIPNHSQVRKDPFPLDAARHTGWIFSLLLATFVHMMHIRVRSTMPVTGQHHMRTRIFHFSGLAVLASYITAIEAIFTDLLGLVPKSSPSGVLFCGNFGIILINTSWITVDGGKTALDLLEKMIDVTMIRGAQSGGVVTFVERHGGRNRKFPSLRGIRSRVVNYKRTDLAKLIRRKVERDTCNAITGNVIGSKHDYVRGFFGHTRFATSSSSNSSFQGTHPHQWTPRTVRRFYWHPNVSEHSINADSSASRPVGRNIEVENYITHNGDLDFYQIGGKNYDLVTVQKWLELALEQKMPTTVDSAAIAGLIDLIRTQGCFALSARYAVCFALATSVMDPDPVDPLPTYRECERIGRIFEDVLKEILSKESTKLNYVCSNPEERDKFAEKVTSRMKDGYEKAVEMFRVNAHKNYSNLPYYSLSQFIDEEKGASLGAFVHATINAYFDNDLLHTTKLFLGHAKGSFGLVVTSSIDAHRQVCIAARGQPMSIAFYPKKGLICYGSEQAAVKAGLSFETPGGDKILGQVDSLSTHYLPMIEGEEILGIDYRYRLAFDRCQLTKFVPHSIADTHLSSSLVGAFIIEVNGKPVRTRTDVTLAVSTALKTRKDTGLSGITLLLSKLEKGEHRADETQRLDLDDLGGEVCLLDWDRHADSMIPTISPPNRKLVVHKLMGNAVGVVVLPESNILAARDSDLLKRMTLLEGNHLIKPLPSQPEDLVLGDIKDIPCVCRSIQRDWQEVNLNRQTAWNFRHCIRKRLQAIADGSVHRHAGSLDIVLTGCEVSLWIAEHFASDLQKAFPKLYIKAISSNKILGLFGQELSIPCIGYPMSQRTHEMENTIVIIVSHSGGSFAPLACSNLLQSATRNIFVVTSEWDTQIGKQVRSMYDDTEIISSRIFSTDVGVRPAEPCSVSVAATHQLLTQLFEHICLTIIGNPRFRHASGAVITEHDLQVLERCNQDNITALENIVGVDHTGEPILPDECKTAAELRKAGDIWAEHVLENAKAYIMTFIYIVGTVTGGYPLVTAVARAAGLATDWAFYITRFVDSLIYFFLPQINILILRLLQSRNLRHRMVGRTVVIGDCPWVAQAADAFLSKLFARSYSIAGLNVLSGNPADHLVHRHTHRVVRGTLLVCGRPDGRLSALTSLEATTCLSVNQASSIESFGGTCESLTIGHNPFKLPLSEKAIFLERHRPKFLCETILHRYDTDEAIARQGSMKWREKENDAEMSRQKPRKHGSFLSRFKDREDCEEAGPDNASRRGRPSLLGIYTYLQTSAAKGSVATDPMRHTIHKEVTLDGIVDDLTKQKAGLERLGIIFHEMDTNKDGQLDAEEFAVAMQKCDPTLSKEDSLKIFQEADIDSDGVLSFDEFITVARMPQSDKAEMLQTRNRNSITGLIEVKPSKEVYFGEDFRKSAPTNMKAFNVSKSQQFSMELYESRIASLQRFVAMTVMFHQMGMRVQTFFPRISFGMLGYRMDQSQSIMRIATTASPVSGADVRERMKYLRLVKTVHGAIEVIERSWLAHKRDKTEKILREYGEGKKRAHKKEENKPLDEDEGEA